MIPRVLLVNQYPIVLQALKGLVESQGFTVVGEARNIEAVRMAAKVQADLAIVDSELPFGRDFDCIRGILEVSPGTKIILLTLHCEEDYVLEALRIGVRGYVLKTKAVSELIQSMNEVAQGQTYFSPEVSRIALQPYFDRNFRRSDRLTDRERQVITLIAEGNSTKEVAARLGISVKTADCHRTRIMDKLNVHQMAHLVRYAIRQGFVQP